MTDSGSKAEAEPFIPYVEEADYPENLRPILDPYVERMGFLPNALKLYMHRPEIAETLWTLNNKVMRDESSTLPEGLKRKLSVVASTANKSAYCTAHTATSLKSTGDDGAEGWSVEEDELKALISGTGGTENEVEEVCVMFVRVASSDPDEVPDALLQEMRRLLTPPQIVELACVVGFWKFYNTVHEALHIPIEAELAENAAYLDLAPK